MDVQNSPKVKFRFRTYNSCEHLAIFGLDINGVFADVS